MVGHHSTSDDSTRYRTLEEIQTWQSKDDPVWLSLIIESLLWTCFIGTLIGFSVSFSQVRRFRMYLEDKGWWDEDKEINLRQIERKNVLRAMSAVSAAQV